MFLKGYHLTDLLANLKKIPLFTGISKAAILKSIEFFSNIDETILEEMGESIQFDEFDENMVYNLHDAPYVVSWRIRHGIVA